MTAEVKKMILEKGKTKIYRHYIKNVRNGVDLQHLQKITFKCKRAIKTARETYIQGGSQKRLLLTTKESIVSSSIFSGPPCI